jgi:hypothetical protein
MPEFTMETQEQDEWCWAAVAVSVNNMLQNETGPWSQASLATKVLKEEGTIHNSVNCVSTPGKCDFPAALNDALTMTGNLAAAHQGKILDRSIAADNRR